MNEKSRLDQITTRPGEKPADMVLRYHKAIRHRLKRYLPEVEDEVFSDIILKILNHGFDAWAPGRGRFHHFLGTAVDRAAMDYFRRQKQKARHEIVRTEVVEQAAGSDDIAGAFGQEVIDQVMRQLSQYQHLRNLQRKSGGRCGPTAYFTILQLKIECPELSNDDLMARLPWRWRNWFRPRPTAFRKQLQHARELFAALLVIEVAAPYQTLQLDLPADIGPGLVRAVGQKLRELEWLQDLLRELKLWEQVQCLLCRTA